VLTRRYLYNRDFPVPRRGWDKIASAGIERHLQTPQGRVLVLYCIYILYYTAVGVLTGTLRTVGLILYSTAGMISHSTQYGKQRPKAAKARCTADRRGFIKQRLCKIQNHGCYLLYVRSLWPYIPPRSPLFLPVLSALGVSCLSWSPPLYRYNTPQSFRCLLDPPCALRPPWCPSW
jgi:hypothetical protein